MKLLFILGNLAVGKMTVGQELMKITELRLLHNHIVIEPVLEVFGEFNSKIRDRLRNVILEEYAASGKYGLIVTAVINFDEQSDWDFLAGIRKIFEPYNTEFYYAELIAPQEIRLQRNTTENRLRHKPSMRHVEDSRQRLLNYDKTHRCVSNEGEIPFDNYMKIDNSNLSPDIVAKMIKERFLL